MEQMNREEAERLVNTYSDLILRLSYNYLHSTYDAEDICQSVFLKILSSKQKFENLNHEKAWIIRTTINSCKDELRLLHREEIALEDVVEKPAPTVPPSDVLDAVMDLPLKYREAIYLFYMEGYSIGEISKILGRSEASVAAHLSRGRKKLRSILGDRDYGQIKSE